MRPESRQKQRLASAHGAIERWTRGGVGGKERIAIGVAAIGAAVLCSLVARCLAHGGRLALARREPERREDVERCVVCDIRAARWRMAVEAPRRLVKDEPVLGERAVAQHALGADQLQQQVVPSVIVHGGTHAAVTKPEIDSLQERPGGREHAS
eukprot:569349-Pleurochrysis_carterae.AAC.1